MSDNVGVWHLPMTALESQCARLKMTRRKVVTADAHEACEFCGVNTQPSIRALRSCADRGEYLCCVAVNMCHAPRDHDKYRAQKQSRSRRYVEPAGGAKQMRPHGDTMFNLKRCYECAAAAAATWFRQR